MTEMVDRLRANGVLQSPDVVEAFETVNRADFLPDDQRKHVSEDRPLPIGGGQTNSQPSTVAFMLEKLQPEQGDTVLDLGAGSGWTTALLAQVMGEHGKVYGVEVRPDLVEFGQGNLRQYEHLRAEIRPAGEKLGLPEEAPFDRILVSAAAEKVPDELVDQLRTGGRMVVAVQNSIMQVDKKEDDSIDTREYPGFAFVPLRHG